MPTPWTINRSLSIESGGSVAGGVISGGERGCILNIGSSTSPASHVIINGTLSGDILTVNATTVYFGPSSVVSVDGTLFSSTAGTGKNSVYSSGGGSHGGSGGGKAAGLAGLAYDSYIFPSMAGSVGGPATQYERANGGAGGGVLTITASESFTAHGTTSANGMGAAATKGAAGGSGGSILIQTNAFAGSGVISANGGVGSRYSSADGAGGSGGRIAVHFYQTTYSGSFTAFGGTATYPGGPGTVYTQDYTTGYRLLMANNNGNSPTLITITTMANAQGSVAWLTETNTTAFEFDEIKLQGMAGLAINPTNTFGTNVPLFIIFCIYF